MRLLAGTRGYSAALAGGRRRLSTGWVLAGTRGTARVLACNGCCGTAEGPRCAVLSCAGPYVSGDAGSNECPAGSARIVTAAACRFAAAAAGKTFQYVGTLRAYPRGCYYDTFDNVAFLNPDPVGVEGNFYSLLLCAAAAAGARVPNR